MGKRRGRRVCGVRTTTGRDRRSLEDRRRMSHPLSRLRQVGRCLAASRARLDSKEVPFLFENPVSVCARARKDGGG